MQRRRYRTHTKKRTEKHVWMLLVILQEIKRLLSFSIEDIESVFEKEGKKTVGCRLPELKKSVFLFSHSKGIHLFRVVFEWVVKWENNNNNEFSNKNYSQFLAHKKKTRDENILFCIYLPFHFIIAPTFWYSTVNERMQFFKKKQTISISIIEFLKCLLHIQLNFEMSIVFLLYNFDEKKNYLHTKETIDSRH